MIDQENRFVIKNYDRKTVFASFLPGICGMEGIPLWCHYGNRGQAVMSFGVEDKERSIMEFFPAHQAYQRVKRMGFRTFLRMDGAGREAFTHRDAEKNMYIGMNTLEIEERHSDQIKTKVMYFTLPEEELPGLVRQVTIKNQTAGDVYIEMIDGMAEMIPYGVDLTVLKEMGQTAKAWMEVEGLEQCLPFVKARASIKDTAQVLPVSGGNFGFALTDEGTLCAPIVNQEYLFEQDSSLEEPGVFMTEGLQGLEGKEQAVKNIMPCCFFTVQKNLAPMEELVIYEVFGQAEDKAALNRFFKKAKSSGYFAHKKIRAEELTAELTDHIHTRTGSREFDLYSRQTYLDNVLRGGYPVRIGSPDLGSPNLGRESKLFYLYSRKHGDVERDYNFFKMLPEYYSQGNGNFRDVNQNRRSDILFRPMVGRSNLYLFYDCIQINGYNPLEIDKTMYRVPGYEDMLTPGALYKRLADEAGHSGDEAARTAGIKEKFAEKMAAAKELHATNFKEGYWTDHWTYNLDLVEAYLAVYPEEAKDLIFDDRSYVYKQAAENILPRKKRYVKTKAGIRQYHFLEPAAASSEYLTDESGKTVKATLAEKIFLLSVLKSAALDVWGMGIEMEGGKPGWYDALNGLPGLLGSSMAETYELARNIRFLLNMLGRYETGFAVPKELAVLAGRITGSMDKHHKEIGREQQLADLYREINEAKEEYFVRTAGQLTGIRVSFSAGEAADILEKLLYTVECGIEKAMEFGGGISPTYFYYQVTEYEESAEGIEPISWEPVMMPYFLEGVVRYLKLDAAVEEKKALYDKVRESKLFDRKLGMYKVNASLAQCSFEIGRAKAFTPGWLENESIWLHMEYKYLLELLKSGLYRQFMDDFKHCAVPFLAEEVYGRSILENSSFIASSANPDPAVHGKGFVARLSGSTAEFLQIWQIMMFGKQPFVEKEGTISCNFMPLVPAYLIGSDQCVVCTLLGSIEVTYHFDRQADYIPGNYAITSWHLQLAAGEEVTGREAISGKLAGQIRDQEVTKITIYINKKQEVSEIG